MVFSPSWNWWWCRPCDVKWYGQEDVCWVCEQSTRRKSGPQLNSQGATPIFHEWWEIQS